MYTLCGQAKAPSLSIDRRGAFLCFLLYYLAGKQTLTSVHTHTHAKRDMYLVKCIGTRFHMSQARIQWLSAYFVQEPERQISAKPKIKLFVIYYI